MAWLYRCLEDVLDHSPHVSGEKAGLLKTGCIGNTCISSQNIDTAPVLTSRIPLGSVQTGRWLHRPPGWANNHTHSALPAL